MAMDDIYRLVRAVLIDHVMYRPKGGYVDLVPKGAWVEATILDSTVSDRGGGAYNGYVRYVLNGEERARDATFHQLWLEGWTCREFRDDVEHHRAAQRKPVPKARDTVYVVTYADGREYINTEPLSKSEHANLRDRRERYREDEYRRVDRKRRRK